MVLPQTNNVTDAYISAGMCVLQRVCVCVRAWLSLHTHSTAEDEAILLLMELGA